MSTRVIYQFRQRWRKAQRRLSPRPLAEIKIEPMLFSASAAYAWDAGGTITRDFLGSAGIGDGDNWIVDSRVHMLMPGWYPCIPGWHHDDVPRTRANGQPDYDAPPYHATHIMAVIDSGTGSMTEFVRGDVLVPRVDAGIVYGEWNRTVAANHRPIRIESGDIIEFDAHDFHRGTPATGTGWRFFIRATHGSHRAHTNEVRRQVQVYLSAPEAGW